PTSQHDDRCLEGFLLDGTRHLVAVHSRHSKIRHDNIERLIAYACAAKPIQASLAVAGVFHWVPATSEYHAQDVEDRRFVIDAKDPQWRKCRSPIRVESLCISGWCAVKYEPH